jgi:hypothetical protein
VESKSSLLGGAFSHRYVLIIVIVPFSVVIRNMARALCNVAARLGSAAAPSVSCHISVGLNFVLVDLWTSSV